MVKSKGTSVRRRGAKKVSSKKTKNQTRFVKISEKVIANRVVGAQISADKVTTSSVASRVHVTEPDRLYINAVHKRHGDNWKKAARDVKINNRQMTARQLEKLYLRSCA
jgi:transcriptional regulator with GAF, ATPase, and Fis domain